MHIYYGFGMETFLNYLYGNVLLQEALMNRKQLLEPNFQLSQKNMSALNKKNNSTNINKLKPFDQFYKILQSETNILDVQKLIFHSLIYFNCENFSKQNKFTFFFCNCCCCIEIHKFYCIQFCLIILFYIVRCFMLYSILGRGKLDEPTNCTKTNHPIVWFILPKINLFYSAPDLV